MASKRSNISVEIIRIIATFIVILVHTASWYTLDGKFLKSEGMIYAFLQDAVPLFWYIMGMFLFRENNTFLKNIVRTGRRVVAPALTLVAAVAILAPWLEGKDNVIACISKPHVDWLGVLGSIGRWTTSGLPLSGHLWVFFSYVKVILWFPLLRFVCVNEKKANAARRYLILIALAWELISDLQQFGTLPTGAVTAFTILDSNLLYVVLGYELSLWLDALRTRKALVFCAGSAAFFLANLFRFFVTKWFYDHGIANQAFMHIEHLISVFSSMGLMTALLMIEPKNETVRKLILKLSSYSFPMYLVHRAVYTRLNAVGARAFIYDKTSTAVTKLLATVSYGMVVFAVSLAVAIAARAVFRFGKTLVLGKQE